MAITLVGEVATTADNAGDFSTLNGGANISGDDDFVQGTGAVGDKMSNTTEILASDNLTSLYNFSVGGANEGEHIIGWVNTKTPLDPTTGIQTYVGNASGHSGVWNNIPAGFYKGGFITRVIDPASDFDSASTWTLTGNPAQLDDVSRMGFQFTTVTSIMGSFNNCQIDQVTVGFGLRADAGTSGSPNTFEDLRSFDEDTNFYGWFTGTGASFKSKGRMHIGPETGDVASWFTDAAFSIAFADEKVATGFYGFHIRGGNTTVSWNLANISSENAVNARWSLQIDANLGSVTGGFTDTNGVWGGSDTIVLNSTCTLDGTAIISGNSLTQNGATLTGINCVQPNVATGVAYIESDDIGLITDSDFESGGAGHAIEITTAGTYDWNGNSLTGYSGTPGSNLVASSGSNDAAIYNNSGGSVTLNVINGADVPAIRNGVGATTTVISAVSYEITGLDAGASVTIVDITTPASPVELFNEVAGGDGIVTYNFDGALSGTPIGVYILNTVIRINEFDDVLPSENVSFPASQFADGVYI